MHKLLAIPCHTYKGSKSAGASPLDTPPRTPDYERSQSAPPDSDEQNVFQESQSHQPYLSQTVGNLDTLTEMPPPKQHSHSPVFLERDLSKPLSDIPEEEDEPSTQ